MIPTPNADTILCISIAERPSRLGTSIHNAGFQALGLNFLYKPCRINDVSGTMIGVRALGIRGCSVSMPFKQSVIPYLDRLDETAEAVGSVNTIVNDRGVLTGYNTDVHGASWALCSAQVRATDRVLVLGAGGMARAFFYALQRHGVGAVAVSNRSPVRAGFSGSPLVPWTARSQITANVLINATPVGMAPDQEAMPIGVEWLRGCQTVIDAVAMPPVSRLVQQAEAIGLITVPGYLMALYQAVRQFELYTGHKAPIEVMRLALLGCLSN